MPRIDKLLGMVNTIDPVRTELGSMASGLNVDIDDTNSAVIRGGQTAFGSFGAITSAFATRDMQQLYVVDSGNLKRVNPDGSATTLQAGMPSTELWWTELGNHVFYSGAAQGMLTGGEHVTWAIPTPTVEATAIAGSLPAGIYLFTAVLVAPDGRQGGSDFARGIELTSPGAIRLEAVAPAGYRTDFYVSSLDGAELFFCGSSDDGIFTFDGPLESLAMKLSDEQDTKYPPPAGEQVAGFQGRIYVAQAHPAADVTNIFFSQPFFYHLFDYQQDFITVPGEVRMLAPTSSALIIGTDREVWAWDGESLAKLAEYGVVEGHSSAPMEDNSILFWTERGLCRALPFENLTESRFSFPPGDRAVVQFLQHNGYSKALVVVRDGGTAFNNYEAG